jgi:hypothetical protein
MSWEPTTEDIQTVAKAHGVNLSDEQADKLLEDLDVDSIEEGVLYYVNFDDQVESANADIEKFLIEQGVVEGDPKYSSPEPGPCDCGECEECLSKTNGS